MKRNNTLIDHIISIPSCIKCTDMVNKLHHIFEFVNKMMCPNIIYTSTKYKFGLNYFYEIPNDSTFLVQNKYRDTKNIKLDTRS